MADAPPLLPVAISPADSGDTLKVKKDSKAEKSSIRGRRPSPVEHKAWLSRVQKTNKSRWTPALRSQYERRAQMQSRMVLQQKRCKRMERSSRMTKSAWAYGMKNSPMLSMSSARGASAPCAAMEEAEEAAEVAVNSASMAMNSLRRQISDDAAVSYSASTFACSPAYSSAAAPSSAYAAASMAFMVKSARADEQLDKMEATLKDAGADLDVDKDEMTKLLDQLKKEPSDDKGRAATFGLYEKYSETITESRKGLLKFWDDCRDDFVSGTGDDNATAVAAPAPAAGAPPQAAGSFTFGAGAAPAPAPETGGFGFGAAPAPAPAAGGFGFGAAAPAAAAGGFSFGAAAPAPAAAGGFGFGASAPAPTGKGGAAVRQIERQLKNIDDPRNMGFPDMSGPTWFVYHMAAKVAKNNVMLEGVLKGINQKLEMLSKQDECPICLEELEGDHEVLGCCHKVCTECWVNWKEMQGRDAFCPLCRHNDFLGTVMQ